jgi:hypothetical protein
MSARRFPAGASGQTLAAMTTSRTGDLLAILQEHFNPAEEGWLWVALYPDDSDGGLLNQIEGDYEEPGPTARALAHILNEVKPDQAFLALCRFDGRPRERDRELWRDLRGLVVGDRLVDLVVFNREQTWSMRDEDAAAA